MQESIHLRGHLKVIGDSIEMVRTYPEALRDS